MSEGICATPGSLVASRCLTPQFGGSAGPASSTTTSVVVPPFSLAGSLMSFSHGFVTRRVDVAPVDADETRISYSSCQLGDVLIGKVARTLPAGTRTVAGTVGGGEQGVAGEVGSTIST